MKPRLLLYLLLLALSLSSVAGSPSVASKATTIVVGESCHFNHFNLITWFPEVIVCPVCKTKNVFLQVGSYGNYIYHYPTKYQLIFWPFTDSPSWYSCKKCRYTSFMGGFSNPPADKLDDLRKMLAAVSLPLQKEMSEKDAREHPPYLALPVSARMLVAEKVQRTLGETGDEFWSHFYRVLGYHFAEEHKSVEADEARQKALAITEKMLADRKNDGQRKELLYLAAAMKHFLRDDEAAKKLLMSASTLTFSNKELDDERNKNYDEYLSTLIKEYLDMLNRGEGPAKMKDKSALTFNPRG